jgi:thiol-disulfide isomerase/thioredoxin
MFLVAPDGVISGRGLDAYALAQMLHQIFDSVELEYGSQESASLYDAIFAGDVPSESDVKALADQIADLTLPKGDTVMFRQMTGDLLYYLSSRSGEGFKEGLGYLIDTYICDSNAWRSQDDSLKVVGFAGIMKDLLSKAKPGTRIADLKVPGVKVTKKVEKAYKRNLRKLGADRNIIIFYTEGCHICDAEKKAARELAAADKNVSVLMVNVDDILRTNQSLASKLFDSFDLSSLPYILETNRKGLIQRRYTSVVSR